VLFLEDEAGGDEKLLAVPEVKTSPYYQDVSEGDHLPPIVLDQIAHFFTHYKDLEPEKWTRVGHWGGRNEAIKVITDGLARAKNVTFQASDATIGEGRAVEA
jgi:inorganic pyrophosphatase